MAILGLNCFMHDSAAALLADGGIACAVEEERLSRRKHTGAFPRRAIDECLRVGGVEFGDLEHVGFYWDPWLTLRHRAWNALRFFPRSLWILRNWGGATDHDTIRGGVRTFVRMVRIGSELRREYGGGRRGPRLHYVPHHLAHAASAFFVSPFEEAAIWTVDGTGERTTSTFARGRERGIEVLREVPFPHSLGAFYGAITQFLGYGVADEEWKVMGLAAYGEPRFYPELRRLVEWKPDGTFRLDLDYFHYQYASERLWYSPKLLELLGPARRADEDPEEPRFADVAASAQKLLEETALHMLRHLHQLSPSERLVIAGGVGLNCAMNGVIRARSPFREVFVQPASHDAGCSLGSALWIAHGVLGRPRMSPLRDAYLGAEYGEEEIERAVDGAARPFRRMQDPAGDVAELLAQGKVVGWFQGRMEFGPRALGNRSILADPRSAEMRDRVNAKVKFRESFRPFAPAVLAERADELFEGSPRSPFMLFVHRVRPEARERIAAVTHADGTARVQTVERGVNPRFHRLICAFAERTGVPVVLNTSFNVAGEPIVATPEDAIACFEHSGLDALALGSWLATKAG